MGGWPQGFARTLSSDDGDHAPETGSWPPRVATVSVNLREEALEAANTEAHFARHEQLAPYERFACDQHEHINQILLVGVACPQAHRARCRPHCCGSLDAQRRPPALKGVVWPNGAALSHRQQDEEKAKHWPRRQERARGALRGQTDATQSKRDRKSIANAPFAGIIAKPTFAIHTRSKRDWRSPPSVAHACRIANDFSGFIGFFAKPA